MSRKSDRAKAQRQAAEDAELRARIAELDARWEAREEQDRQRTQQLLTEERYQREQERAQLALEREPLQLQNYITTRVNQELKDKRIAPQFVDFINGTSKEQVEAQIELAQAKTAEILAEVGQMNSQQADRPRDTRTGRFIPAEPADPYLPRGITADELTKAQNRSLSMEDYARMRDRLGLGRHDAGIFN